MFIYLDAEDRLNKANDDLKRVTEHIEQERAVNKEVQRRQVRRNIKCGIRTTEPVGPGLGSKLRSGRGRKFSDPDWGPGLIRPTLTDIESPF
jgi:hypothetical protein